MKKKNFSHRVINRCRIQDQVQDSSQIDLPSHPRVWQGMKDSDLTGDSSLARAFESKHGNLQLRGSNRSSIDEPGQSTSIGTSIDY